MKLWMFYQSWHEFTSIFFYINFMEVDNRTRKGHFYIHVNEIKIIGQL